MRKIIFVTLLATLFCPAVSLANPGAMGMCGKDSSAPPAALCADCGTCGGCATADVACEDWDTNLCTWTDDYDANADQVGPLAHSGTLACADKGDYALDIVTDVTGDMFTYFDAGSQLAVTYTQVYVNIVSHTLEDGDTQPLIYLDQAVTGTTNAAMASTYMVGSDLKIGYKFRTGATFSSIYYSSALTVGTWHRIGIFHDYTNGAVGFYVDGTEIYAGTGLTVDRAPRYWILGSSVAAAADAYHAQFDNFQLDATAMPGACP